MNKLEIENGKYQIKNNNGIVKVYRYGKLWLNGVSKFELCLIQRIEELEKALEFYADRENYESDHYDPDTHDYTSIIDHDKGATARKALEGRK